MTRSQLVLENVKRLVMKLSRHNRKPATASYKVVTLCVVRALDFGDCERDRFRGAIEATNAHQIITVPSELVGQDSRVLYVVL